MGYPLEGLSASYSGLCAFDCPYGYCPDNACGTVSAPLSIPTVSDFLPPACIAGTGEGGLAGLCSFAIVRGEPYTVTGGSINVNGAVIQVPNIGGSEQISTTIDNVPMVIIPSYSGTMAVPVLPTAKPTSAPHPGSGSDLGPSSTSTITITTSTSAPIPPAADGCALMGGIQGVCWNKCDPATGNPVGGTWEEGDAWCWLKDGDIGAFCKTEKDCPSKLEYRPSDWRRGGCSKPPVVSGGCALMNGVQGVCWSECSVNTPLSIRDLLVSDNRTSRAIAGPRGLRLDLYF